MYMCSDVLLVSGGESDTLITCQLRGSLLRAVDEGQFRRDALR
jgi:hypothetical protein